MPRKVLFLLVVLVIFLAAAPDVVAQCAMCKEAAEASMKDNPTSMARSLNKGILYLMAVPYLMIAFIFRKQIGSAVRRLRLKAGRQRN